MDSLGEVRARLQKRWLYSHEEDTDAVTVYRPAHYPFPRSRGRTGFDLRPNGVLIDIRIAPADGPDETRGTWDVQDGVSPTLLLRPAASAPRTLRIAAIDEDRLDIEKGP